MEKVNNLNLSTASVEINKEVVTEKEVNKAKFPDLRVIGQFNKTYILAEYLDTLYIIDQHAAQERVRYEKYQKLFLTTIILHYYDIVDRCATGRPEAYRTGRGEN